MIAADHRPFHLRILRSGSSGNAILLDAAGTRVLIDAGLPADTIARELTATGTAPADLAAILLTHEHDDHARGAGAFSRLAGVPVYANEATLTAAGLRNGLVERFTTGRPFAIGALTVEAFAVSHDAAEPVGFAVGWNGTTILVATDLGEAGDELIARARGADVLVMEANYDLRLLAVSPYPWFLKNRIVGVSGHLSNDAAARAVVAAGSSGRPQTVVLVHLSDINNLTPLARDTVQWELDRDGMNHVRVHAVRPNGASDLLP
ncbi:MAG TPA: MBL fold metallo-hydrolase [bacterium]|jgi:phosphoribosyl 1,2-cyclic phosphodiesterase|nr:MBL fold metallo-hydrolase [bacterium]